jgi:hypothetical protein
VEVTAAAAAAVAVRERYVPAATSMLLLLLLPLQRDRVQRLLGALCSDIHTLRVRVHIERVHQLLLGLKHQSVLVLQNMCLVFLQLLLQQHIMLTLCV